MGAGAGPADGAGRGEGRAPIRIHPVLPPPPRRVAAVLAATARQRSTRRQARRRASPIPHSHDAQEEGERGRSGEGGAQAPLGEAVGQARTRQGGRQAEEGRGEESSL
ncbi:non-histone chromosomal protein HMG-14 isoform X1 [Meriones unguiculatus]|uniref:non-histone chromosomal protein HMG-14 isoform X1 n=1 Tax=Meriones unguiculatus TaxID=10047 RepID=UPI00293ED7BF|nr:non-histone chromosomal protein HMG-14 isoform X1 [Meriones unguiculatus]